MISVVVARRYNVGRGIHAKGGMLRRKELRTSAYKITRPRSLRTTLKVEMKRARSANYTASNDFENACMDGDWRTADRIRTAQFSAWIRKVGAWNARRIQRPIKSA